MPGMTAERLGLQTCLQIAQLALGTPARQVPVLDRGDTSRVITAVFEPTQRVDEIAPPQAAFPEFRRFRTFVRLSK